MANIGHKIVFRAALEYLVHNDKLCEAVMGRYNAARRSIRSKSFKQAVPDFLARELLLEGVMSAHRGITPDMAKLIVNEATNQGFNHFIHKSTGKLGSDVYRIHRKAEVRKHRTAR